jgi:hypothetical protein
VFVLSQSCLDNRQRPGAYSEGSALPAIINTGRKKQLGQQLI